MRAAIEALGPEGRWDRWAANEALRWLGHASRLPAAHPLAQLLRLQPHYLSAAPPRGRRRYQERFRGTWHLRVAVPAERLAERFWRDAPEAVSDYMLRRPEHWTDLARHRDLWRAAIESST